MDVSAKPEMDRTEKLRRLALLLSDGDRHFGEEVVSSEKSPEEYVSLHARELKLRGITRPADGLCWIALADGLQNMGKLVELDWKESPAMFAKAAAQILEPEPDGEKIAASLAAMGWRDSEEIPEIVRRINEALDCFGYTVFLIDLRSDSYPLSAARTAVFRKIDELARSIDNERIVFF